MISRPLHGTLVSGDKFLKSRIVTQQRHLHQCTVVLIVVAIHSDKALRYERLAQRKFRPLTKTEVDRRDYTEIENIEKGGPIAIADYHILNNGDVSILRQNLLELMDKILTDDNSR